MLFHMMSFTAQRMLLLKLFQQQQKKQVIIAMLVEIRASHLGKLEIFPHFSIQNFLGPLLPLSAANPSYGTDDVPVTNCNSRSRRSLS